MDIPKLPTDNLYKFIAMSGLITLIISFLYPLYFEHEFVLKVLQNTTEATKARVELDHLTEDLNSLIRELASLDKDFKRGKLKEYVIRVEQMAITEKEVKEKGRQIAIKNAEIQGKAEAIDYLKASTEMIKNYSIGFKIIGLSLAVFGFYLWYVKLQRYQDKQVKKDATGT